MIRAFHCFGHSYFHYVLTCLLLKVNLRLYPGSWQIWRGRYHHKHRSSPSRSQGTAPQVTQGPPRADTLGSGKDDGFPTKPALLSGTQQSHGKHAKVCTEFVTRKKHTTTKTTFYFFFLSRKPDGFRSNCAVLQTLFLAACFGCQHSQR